MGGQTAYENSLHIDMRSFNRLINLDTENKQITIQSGMTWRYLQKIIDPHDLAVKIMQTYANFTVGGSLSVNCHGRYIGHGPIISSVLEIKIITANGERITANRNTNSEIFKAAIGGYGGIGIITQATLQLVDNVKVERQTNKVSVNNFNNFFNDSIRNNKNIVFQNGDLYPPHYDKINNVSWKKTNKDLTDEKRITSENETYWIEPKLVEVVSWGDFGKWFRRSIIDPYIYSSDKVVWRNREASYDVKELEPSSRESDTYVLQEYFIPTNNINVFIPKMKAIYDKYNVNVINISLRHAFPDDESYLSWAKEEVFAFVVYYKQGTDNKSKKIVHDWTNEMTEAILNVNGSWYLPYQPHASISQFKKGYPNAEKYFNLKAKLDTANRFNNQLLDKYNPYTLKQIEKEKNNINDYNRSEEQTILTIPEWYLVYNPKEFADYLEEGKNPSDFPYYASIDEYWKLYDRSIKLVSEGYPKNEEYTTMLNVIGVSITMEYAFKIIYENTIGKLFGLFANNKISEQEKTIIKAHRAYSDFIYNTAWYEFEFMPWIKKVWISSDQSNASFLRKWERTIFFTIEFSFKAFYAQLIEWAATASYEAPTTDIYLLISSNENSLSLHDNIKTIKIQDEKQIISIPRWGEFTKTLIEISNKNIIIHNISGNDEIAVSIITNKDVDLEFNGFSALYESRVVSQKDLKRIVYFLPVNKLIPFIQHSKKNNFVIEHIYDY
ncbi:MAG: hypothetical protein VR77_07955 [Flavobacteriales bacterium BRH_c54]|nr:MAG: hypothetical protein VR77_07955 [Flavobacteriales bacterium BRH_c54]